MRRMVPIQHVNTANCKFRGRALPNMRNIFVLPVFRDQNALNVFTQDSCPQIGCIRAVRVSWKILICLQLLLSVQRCKPKGVECIDGQDGKGDGGWGGVCFSKNWNFMSIFKNSRSFFPAKSLSKIGAPLVLLRNTASTSIKKYVDLINYKAVAYSQMCFKKAHISYAFS